MSAERPFTDDIVTTLYVEFEFAPLCETELGSSRELVSRMLETGVSIGQRHLPRLALECELGVLTSVTVLDPTVAREERIETVLCEEEVSRELVGRGLDQLHPRSPPLQATA
ncbi:hypothetical protein [Natrinema sp. HArc-T2]|uniref:hypothetical protein n=1 Tax=Natrinema sp. HArc-T2 TaxID=3242701 RepID=UPI00359EB5F1